jgi:acetyl esterase
MTAWIERVHPALRGLLDADGDAPIDDLPAARAVRRAAALERSGAPVEVAGLTQPTEGIRLYEPPTRSSDGVIMLIHGGGWVWGGPDEIDGLARRLCVASGRRTATMRYRLAPEHRYPAALDDADAAVRWIDQNLRAPVTLVGLSAGGNLAAALSSRRRDRNEPTQAQVLVYPMLDPHVDSRSAHTYATAATLSRDRAKWFWDQYRPAATPYDDDPTGLPPTYVVLAECDVLLDEGLAYARKVGEARVRTDVRVWPGMLHGFLPWAGLIPDAVQSAVDDIARWITARPAPD